VLAAPFARLGIELREGALCRIDLLQVLAVAA